MPSPRRVPSSRRHTRERSFRMQRDSRGARNSRNEIEIIPPETDGERWREREDALAMFESAYPRAICARTCRDELGLAEPSRHASRIDRKSVSRGQQPRDYSFDDLRDDPRKRAGKRRSLYERASRAKLSPTCCPPRGNFPTRAGKLPVCPPIHTFSGTIPLSRPWRSAWNNFLNLLPSSIRTCVSAAAKVSHRLVKRLVRPSRTLLALAVLPFPCVLRCRRCYRLADSPVSFAILPREKRETERSAEFLNSESETFAS